MQHKLKVSQLSTFRGFRGMMPSHGPGGISLLMIRRDTPGVQTTRLKTQGTCCDTKGNAFERFGIRYSFGGFLK